MAENKQNTTPERRPDCVTEIRICLLYTSRCV